MQAAGTSTAARRDVDELVNALVGNRGLDSGGDVTPSSSMPGTPPRQSALFYGTSSLSPSGRISRQSDGGSDKNSLGAAMMGTANSGTDHVMERCVVTG